MPHNLRQLARDLQWAADHIEHEAGAVVQAEGTHIETEARALNISGGVAMTMDGPAHVEVSSTQDLGVLSAAPGGRIIPSDTARIADHMAADLAEVGKNLVLKGHA